MIISHIISPILVSYFSWFIDRKYIIFFFEDCTGAFNLCTDLDKDRLGREAVRTIHEQMDDDKDGKIEVSESQDVRWSIGQLISCLSSILFV